MPIASLIDQARRENAAHGVYDTSGELRHVIAKPAAAAVHTVNLRELELPTGIAHGIRQVRVPYGTEAGTATRFESTLITSSRVSQAGARIVLVADADDPVAIPGGGIAFQRRNSGYSVIEPADFAVVLDGAEVTESTLPVHRAEIDLETMPAYGFRVPLSRAEQNQYEAGQLGDTALASIAMGIARAADKALLSAIVASNPAAFTLAAAAELGLEFAELRALVGTDAAGAAVSQDGTLRAAGVLAELTPAIAETVVGAFSRSAVAVHEDIRLIAERTNTRGDLVLTCWMNMEALLPQTGAFWTVEV